MNIFMGFVFGCIIGFIYTSYLVVKRNEFEQNKVK